QRPQLRKLYDRPRLVPLDYEGMPVMSIGFIVEPEQAVVLRGPRLGGIIKQFFNEVLWPPLDYLVVDLPPGTGDIQLTLVQTAALTGALIVTTPQEVAVADAVKAMNMFRHPSVKVPVLGVVENMSWFTPKELPENRYFIFGQGGGAKLADQGNVPLLGQIPLILGIREGGDEGRPAMTQDDPPLRRPFLDLAEKVLERVRWREENLEPTQPVQVSR
ncbi:MAG: chromosome partitioning protein, partial [Bacteroidetes bacterium]